MKHIALMNLKYADSRAAKIPSDELQDAIDILYSNGYIYDPYRKHFINLFINKAYKASLVSTFDNNKIAQILKDAEKEFNLEKVKHNSLGEIEQLVFGDGKKSRIRMFTSGLEGIIGAILFIIAIAFHFFDYLQLASAIGLASFCFTIYYTKENALLQTIEGDFEVSIVWKRYQIVFFATELILYLYLYYLLYLTLNSYWIPVVILLGIRYLINAFCYKVLSKSYLQKQFYSTIKKYATEKSLEPDDSL